MTLSSCLLLMYRDKDIRELASKALGRLVAVSRPRAITLLNDLLPLCFSTILAKRHGALLGIAELLHHISLSVGPPLPQEMLNEISLLIPKIEKARLYRGRGAEILREASCLTIENIAIARIPMSVKGQVALVEILNDNLKHPQKYIQVAAVGALRQALFTFFGHSPDPEQAAPSERLRKLTVEKYLSGLLQDDNVAATRGYASALGQHCCNSCTLPSNDMAASSDSFGVPQWLFHCVIALFAPPHC